MEYDSVHSKIDSRLKSTDINVPSDYVSLIEPARKKRGKYKVKVLDFTFFKNYKDETTLKSIKPSKLSGPPYVVDIGQLQYTQNGEILYKIEDRKESCWTPISESVTLKKELIDPRNRYLFH